MSSAHGSFDNLQLAKQQRLSDGGPQSNNIIGGALDGRSVIQEIIVRTQPFPSPARAHLYLNNVACAIRSFFLALHEAYLDARELKLQAEQRYPYLNFDR